jgi:hypothetical protein
MAVFHGLGHSQVSPVEPLKAVAVDAGVFDRPHDFQHFWN